MRETSDALPNAVSFHIQDYWRCTINFARHAWVQRLRYPAPTPCMRLQLGKSLIEQLTTPNSGTMALFSIETCEHCNLTRDLAPPAPCPRPRLCCVCLPLYLPSTLESRNCSGRFGPEKTWRYRSFVQATTTRRAAADVAGCRQSQRFCVQTLTAHGEQKQRKQEEKVERRGWYRDGQWVLLDACSRGRRRHGCGSHEGGPQGWGCRW